MCPPCFLCPFSGKCTFFLFHLSFIPSLFASSWNLSFDACTFIHTHTAKQFTSLCDCDCDCDFFLQATKYQRAPPVPSKGNGVAVASCNMQAYGPGFFFGQTSPFVPTSQKSSQKPSLSFTQNWLNLEYDLDDVLFVIFSLFLLYCYINLLRQTAITTVGNYQEQIISFSSRTAKKKRSSGLTPEEIENRLQSFSLEECQPLFKLPEPDSITNPDHCVISVDAQPCAICLSEFEAKCERRIRRLPCNHFFHQGELLGNCSALEFLLDVRALIFSTRE